MRGLWVVRAGVFAPAAGDQGASYGRSRAGRLRFPLEFRGLHFSQLLRRGLQLSVIAFIVYSAFGGVWRNYKLAHNSPRLVELMEGTTWGFLYGLNEEVLSLFGEPAEASLGLLGFPWAATIFGFDTADPIMVISYIIGTGSLRLELLFGLLLPLGLALVFGKVFCSHLCPMRLLFELGQAARKGLVRLGLELPSWRNSSRFGGWVLLGGLLAALGSSTLVWFFVLPYTSLAATIFIAVTTGGLSGTVVVVLAWFLVDMLLAPGAFCYNLCPTGFLLETVNRFSLIRLFKTGEEPCPAACHQCLQSCPYGLSPRDQSHHPACDNCGRCVAACPSDRLVRRIGGLPIVNLALVFALSLSLVPASARAHHNKGLPHYGYFENYPQVPTEEYIAVDGRWEIGATFFNFQGLDRQNADTPNDVKIFLYLYDLEADKGYGGPLSVEIRYRGTAVSRFDRLEIDEESVYSTRETLPHSGDYELVAFVEGVEQPVVLPFHVDLSGDGIRWGLIGMITSPVLVLFSLATIGGRRRRRRR